MFNLYPGEEKPAFVLSLLGFVWALGISAGDTLTDALFLINVGSDKLAPVFIATALAMFAAAILILYSLNHFHISKLYKSVLLAGAIFYTLAYLALSLNMEANVFWFWLVLKVFAYLFLAILTMCYWSFIDQYYSLQDAKRLFCLFSSSVFLGVAASGQIIAMNILDTKGVFLLPVFCMLISIQWIKKIIPGLEKNNDNIAENDAVHQKSSIKELIITVLSSRFTILLLSVKIFVQLLEIVTEYEYMQAFENYFVAHAGDDVFQYALTAFIGKLSAVVAVVNIIFGIFIYGRIIRIFGINNSVLIIPSIFLLLFSSWLFSGRLCMPIMGFTMVSGLLYTIDDNNFALLLNGVPSKVKSRVRVIIESFFEPFGMLISASLLLFFPESGKIIGFFLSCGIFATAILLRSSYFKAIRNNLYVDVSFDKELEAMPVNLMKNKELYCATSKIEKSDEHTKILAFEILLHFKERGLLPYLFVEAENIPSAIKFKVMELLSRSPLYHDILVAKYLEELKEYHSDQSSEIKLLLPKLQNIGS